MQKIWLLAEPESFYLPGLIRRLCEKNSLAGIIEIHFDKPLRLKLIFLLRLRATLGLGTLVLLVVCSIFLALKRFFVRNPQSSLKRMALHWNLPYFKCSGFSSLIADNNLKNRIGSLPIFVQVSKRVPKELVDRFILINKHCSLLPKYAGVYPVFWAMLLREKEQGVTIHIMNEEFDQGRILVQRGIPNQGSFFEIYHELYSMTGDLILELLQTDLDLGTYGKVPDLSQHSYFSFPKSEDRRRFLKAGFRFGIPRPFY